MRAATNTVQLEPKDFVDHLVEQWKREQPNLDTNVAAIVVRMKRATAIFDRARERLAQLAGLRGSELMLLDALRRSGPPYCLKPGVLMRELLIPSGTATRWIDAIEERRLVKRLADSEDRRGILISLTPLGRRTLDKLDKAHGFRGSESPEHSALFQLGRSELQTLSSLLRKALLGLEGHAEPPASSSSRNTSRNSSQRTRIRRNLKVPRSTNNSLTARANRTHIEPLVSK
ncbi:MAG: MarR family winged helix-turn-helix transcriptional regulator [Candidatus Binataceae bacterium]